MTRLPVTPAALLLAVGAAAAPLLAVAPAAAQDDRPQLSIAVDNGRTTAQEGDTLDYAVTVRNLGTDPVTDLTITQSVPTTLELRSADRDGIEEPGRVRWSVDLAPAAESTFRTTMTVRPAPADQLRVATVACAATTPDGAPLVCASHSDALPTTAAVAAEPQQPWVRRHLWPLIAATAVLLAAVLTAAVRRRPAGAPPASEHREKADSTS